RALTHLGSKDKIDEEQLQYGITGYLLSRENPDLEKLFQTSVEGTVKGGTSYEDAVKIGLKKLVTDGKLTLAHAEELNGLSFRAAQLDKHLDMLFDSKEGPGDNTIAVARMDHAIDKADGILSAALSGKLTVPPRSLDSVSNPKGLFQ